MPNDKKARVQEAAMVETVETVEKVKKTKGLLRGEAVEEEEAKDVKAKPKNKKSKKDQLLREQAMEEAGNKEKKVKKINGKPDKGQMLQEKPEGRKEGEEEGQYLLGSPTFTPLGNGRFRCEETGHELPAKEMESYGRCKRCRIGIIDAFLKLNKAPLNSFSQHPEINSKLLCKLTGDTINKSEEHIWKHISGKKFQHKLGQIELEKGAQVVEVKKKSKATCKPSKPSKNNIMHDEKSVSSEDDPQANKPSDHNKDIEERDFWMPPAGRRWDFDDGSDRWESPAHTGGENDEGIRTDDADNSIQADVVSEVLCIRTKRMSVAVEPSYSASKKKKKN